MHIHTPIVYSVSLDRRNDRCKRRKILELKFYLLKLSFACLEYYLWQNLSFKQLRMPWRYRINCSVLVINCISWKGYNKMLLKNLFRKISCVIIQNFTVSIFLNNILWYFDKKINFMHEQKSITPHIIYICDTPLFFPKSRRHLNLIHCVARLRLKYLWVIRKKPWRNSYNSMQLIICV